MVLVMAISATLLTLTSLSLLNVRAKTFVDTSEERLLSDIKYQQLSAMNGASGGTGDSLAYGINFESQQYTLFQGDTFDPSDPLNFTVNLDSGTSLSSITFPGSQIIFEKGSGEIRGFVDGQNTLTISDSTGTNSANITINKLGVMTGIN